MKLSDLPTGTRIVYLGPGTELRTYRDDPGAMTLVLDVVKCGEAPAILMEDSLVPPGMLVVHDTVGFIGPELAASLGSPDGFKVLFASKLNTIARAFWEVQF